MRRSLTVNLVSVLILALSCEGAFAQSSMTVTIPIQANINGKAARPGSAPTLQPMDAGGCQFTTTGVNLGGVNPLIVEQDVPTPSNSAAGDILINCGAAQPATTIGLDTGQNGAIAPILGIGTNVTAVRAMTNGTSFLLYDLFQPTAVAAGGVSGQGTCEWGSGSNLALGSNSTCSGHPGLTITDAQYSACLTGGGSGGCPITVYAAIPSDQVQPLTPGIYTDTVNATVSFVTPGSSTPTVIQVPITIQATVTGGCLINSTGINFGVVSPFSIRNVSRKAPYSADGEINIACGNAGPPDVVIALDNGANGPLNHLPPKSTATRAMTNQGSFLAYDLLKPNRFMIGSSCSLSRVSIPGSEWGSGAPTGGAFSCLTIGLDEGGAGTSFMLPFQAFAAVQFATEASLITIPVHASIPAGQLQHLTPGIYTDTVAATVTFQ